MRTFPLHEFFSKKSASFIERFGVKVPSIITDKESEYHIIRDRVGITDFSFMQKTLICVYA